MHTQLLTAIGSILFAFADTPDKYWRLVFPGMVISMTGLAAAYVGANMTIMGDARKGEEVRCVYLDLAMSIILMLHCLSFRVSLVR
jgi:hypothetical protein